MNEPQHTSVLDMIIRKLDKLADFTNNEINNMKVKLAIIMKDLRLIKDKPNPVKEDLKEIVQNERLKIIANRPKKFMEVFGWIVAATVGIITILYAIEKLFK